MEISHVIVILLTVLGCKKIEDKTTLLIAEQNFNDVIKIDKEFKIFSDSTYVFTKTIVEDNQTKTEKWTGQLLIIKDTIRFFPFRLEYNQSQVAVLKNGFIEFTDGEYLERMKIEKTSLLVKNHIDLNRFQNFAVFTFYEKFHQQPWEKEYSNYDLNTQELLKIDTIFKNEFRKNKKLKNYSDYLKQIVCVKNSKNQIVVQAHFFCKDSHLMEDFQYYETSMMDGGNCNVYIKFNLTTGKFDFINFASMA